MNKLSSEPCLIVTLCKSPNYGAYLQAFALKEILSSYNFKVSFLDVYDEENNKKRSRFLFRGSRKNPLNIMFNIRKYFAFRYAEKKLSLAPRGDVSDFKAAFIGSDEIWCVTNGTFNPVPEFFGLDLTNVLRFSYAPSVGNTGMDDLAHYYKYMEGLKKFDLLSVRDNQSLDIVTKVTGRNDIPVVLDPTFLYDFSDQREEYTVGKPYILVYTYGFSEGIAKEVKDYAQRNRIMVVSAGFYHGWVDKNIPCNPFEFLSLVKGAECVITDTFHGSIFSIKYRKNFICYGRHKKKVKYLLESLGLDDCLVDEGYLKNCVNIETYYSSIESTLEPLLEESYKYLERCNSMVSDCSG
jgi:hypothetical protein